MAKKGEVARFADKPSDLHPDNLVGRMHVLRRKKGLIDTSHIGWIDKTTGRADLSHMPHAEGDGISLLTWFLRDREYPCDPLPQARDPEEPTFAEIKRLSRGQNLTEMPPARVDWKKTGPFGFQEDTPLVYDWRDRERTGEMKQQAREAGTSLLAFLYAALNRAVADLLIEGDDAYRWFCPVNMRGAVGAGPDNPNAVSALYLPAEPGSTAQDFGREITSRLKAKQHWSLWKQLRLTRFIGTRATAAILDLIASNSRFAGTFTLVGEWPLAGQDNPPEDPGRVLVIGGPTSPSYPVSCAALLWHGQLSVSIKLHKSLLVEPDLAERVLERMFIHLDTGDVLTS